MKRGHRRGARGFGARAGFTLIELMIGTFIALFLTAAAVLFATHETRLLGYSADQAEMQQSAKVALELLARDIEMAGAGIGRNAAGRFVGLQIGGSFPTLGPPSSLIMNVSEPVANNLGFTNLTLYGSGQTGAESAAVGYVLPTEDIGILMADGPKATIALQAGLSGEYCDDGSVFPGGDPRFVVFQNDARTAAFSTLFTPLSSTTCSFGECTNGCRSFVIADDPYDVFATDATAATLAYTGGEINGDFKQVVWFVQNDLNNPSTASLRRAEITSLAGQCNDRNTCGGEVAYNIETLQYQVYRLDPTVVDNAATANRDERWVLMTTADLTTPNRLRVDIELVVRSARQELRPIAPVRLGLRANTCAPGGAACPTGTAQWDFVERRAHRVTVEVKNAAFNRSTN